MRKYFIAGVIAITVFAVSAFAASLAVDGGVLQAGNGGIGECTEEIVVTYGNVTRDDGMYLVGELTLDSTNGASCEDRAFQAVVTTGEPDPSDLSNVVEGAFVNGVAKDVEFEPFDAEQAGGVDVVVWDAYSTND
jgi:hypothetical protein